MDARPHLGPPIGSLVDFHLITFGDRDRGAHFLLGIAVSVVDVNGGICDLGSAGGSPVGISVVVVGLASNSLL